MTNKIEKNSKKLLTNIVNTINESKRRAFTYVNNEIILLYWRVGKLILNEIKKGEKRAKYGENLVKNLSFYLIQEHGKGWSSRNLWRMVKFYEIFPKVTEVRSQLSWTHYRELLSIKNNLQRKFYLEMAKINKWSTTRLRKEMNSMLFERVGLSKKPNKLIKQELNKLEKKEISQNIIFKDPYILNFLDLKDVYSEKNLEDKILINLQQFLLELGDDFAFLERQKRLIIGGQDYYIDLLFYNRKLDCLVAIELKIGKFKSEHKGQMELYLKYLEKHVTKKSENSPIGIILCADKDIEVIELLFDKNDNIKIAEFLTVFDKKILKKKVFKSIKTAKTNFNIKKI